MTLHQFKALSEIEQEAALRDAVLLLNREAGEHTIYLLQLDSFYVEIYCHKRNPCLGRYRPFDSLDDLELYLQKMEIDLG